MFNRRLTNSVTIVLLSVAFVMLFAPAGARAWCQLTTESSDNTGCTHNGIPLAWKQPCISYAVAQRVLIDPETGKVLGPNDNPPFDEVLDTIDASFKTWTSVTCDGRPLGFTIKQLKERSQCTKPQQNRYGPNVNSIAFLWDWEERGFDSDAFAFTSVFHSSTTGEILGVDIEVNETLGTLGDCCPNQVCPASGTSAYCYRNDIVDIQNVITHEAGHFFGLDDERDPMKAAMDPTAMIGDISKRFLTSDDKQGICSIYPEGSLPDKCDFTPPNGLSLSCYYSSKSYSCGSVAVGGSPGGPTGPIAIAGIIGLTALLARRRGNRTRRLGNRPVL